MPLMYCLISSQNVSAKLSLQQRAKAWNTTITSYYYLKLQFSIAVKKKGKEEEKKHLLKLKRPKTKTV